MNRLCLSALPFLFALAACNQGEPGLWENTSKSEYATYCDIQYCDDIETSVKPECTCPCKDDSDDCMGDGCDDGGGDGGECTGSDCGDGGGGGDCECSGSDCVCTLTQGYWKNHNQLETQARRQLDWPAPLDEAQQLCGQALLDILNIAPRGEAWYILAHQYIAASLNVAAGADDADVASALAESKAILAASCGGVTTDRQRAIDLSYLLDSFNNGLIGPGHCDG